MPPSLREYNAAELRLRQSLELRGAGFVDHDYPQRAEDLSLMRDFHAEYGYPPASTFGRLWWWVRGWMGE